jgi:hypothetical protein
MVGLSAFWSLERYSRQVVAAVYLDTLGQYLAAALKASHHVRDALALFSCVPRTIFHVSHGLTHRRIEASQNWYGCSYLEFRGQSNTA